MKFTVLGGGGFVGGYLIEYLRGKGHVVRMPARGASPLDDDDPGHVVYAIGLTGDFRTRTQATVDAHVNVLNAWLDSGCASFVYLSSTRIYGGLPLNSPATENTAIAVRPCADTIYDLSKLLGEALCLACPSPAIRVARLANVYGEGQSAATFLGAVLRDAVRQKQVEIGEAADSAKDYVSVADVATLLEAICLRGRERIYNVASGVPLSHEKLAAKLRDDGCAVTFRPGGGTRAFPPVNIERIRVEFGFTPRHLLDDIPALLYALKASMQVEK